MSRGQSFLLNLLKIVSFGIFIWMTYKLPGCGCGDKTVPVSHTILIFFGYIVFGGWAIFLSFWILWFLTAIPEFIFNVVLGEREHRENYFDNENWFGHRPFFSLISFVREFYGYSHDHPYAEKMILSVNYDNFMKFCTLGLYRKKQIRLDKDTTFYKFMFFLSVISVIELISMLIESMFDASIWIMFVIKVLICLALLPIEKKLIKDKI